MLRKIFGYFLGVTGFLGLAYFRSYSGSVISYPWIWLCLSIIIGLVGLALITTGRSNKVSKQERYNKERLKRLRQNGEKLLLTTENCEIKGNNYYEEDLHKNMTRIEMIDDSFDPNRNYSQHYVEQSAIIYYYDAAHKKQEMTSQSFPFNTSTLTHSIQNKQVYLYVDRFDKNDYAFELLG